MSAVASSLRLKVFRANFVTGWYKPEERQDGKEPVLVKISVASGITGYSVNYLYHLASKGMIPCVKRGRTLRFDMEELKKWMQQQYVPASNRLPDEKEKK